MRNAALGRVSRRAGALAIAAALQLALFALLDLRAVDAPPVRDETQLTYVTLAPIAPLRRPPSATAPAHEAAPPSFSVSPSPATPPVGPPAAPAPAAPGATGPSTSAGDRSDLAAALRHGDIGCANASAGWLTDSERERCRERLAANVAQVPHLEAMAPEKLAYFAAVAKAEDDWKSGRDPGHLPGIFCGMHPAHGRANVESGPPHALRIGPCRIEPPKGSLDVDVDVPAPGGPQPYSGNTAQFPEPIPSAIHQR